MNKKRHHSLRYKILTWDNPQKNTTPSYRKEKVGNRLSLLGKTRCWGRKKVSLVHHLFSYQEGRQPLGTRRCSTLIWGRQWCPRRLFHQNVITWLENTRTIENLWEWSKLKLMQAQQIWICRKNGGLLLKGSSSRQLKSFLWTRSIDTVPKSMML